MAVPRRMLGALIVTVAMAAMAAVAAPASSAPAGMSGSPRDFAVTRGVPFTAVVATFSDTTLGAVRDTTAYVDRVYNDLLGRPVDEFGAAYWVTRIDAGIGRGVLPPALVGSTEWANHEVVRLYQDPAYLGRQPSGDEAAFWAGLVAAGTPLQTLRASFLGSTEWVDAHGGLGDPPTVVDGLYQSALGRPADPGGQTYFAGLLANGTSATTIAGQLLASTEGLGHTISVRWRQYLGRDASPGEQTAWVATFAGPSGERILLVALASCDEYFGTIPSDYTATVAWAGGAPLPASLRRAGGNTVEVVATQVLTVDGANLSAAVTVTRTGQPPLAIPSTIDVVGSRNERFLGGFYGDTLGRGLDDSGRGYWMPRIATGGAKGRSVATGLVVLSTEWDQHEATAVASDPRYLGRPPTASELSLWTPLAHTSVDALRSVVLGTLDYYNAHGGTDSGFVDGLFDSVLHRPSDPEGKAYFVGLLASNPREYVALVMIISREARVAEARDLYTQYLHRNASDAEAGGMADALTAGTYQSAIVAITASGEYFGHFPLANGSVSV